MCYESSNINSKFYSLERTLTEMNRPLSLLTNREWLWKLAFLVNITKHTNAFNFKLKDKKKYSHLRY